MDNKDYLVDIITQDVAMFILEDTKVDYDKALSLFYKSKTFEHLLDKKLDLTKESPAYIYELYKEEELTS